MVRFQLPSFRTALAACIVSPLVCSGSAVAQPRGHAHSSLVRPALLETDLPALIRFLELDEAQEAAIRALLQDQLDADERSMAQLRQALRQSGSDHTDALGGLREAWGMAWDRDRYPLTTEEGRAELRVDAAAYLDKVEAQPERPSVAAGLLARYGQTVAGQRAQLMEDLSVLLDASQQDRLLTADAATALARSTWPPVFGQEKLNLDALLVTTLGDQAMSPQWVRRRSLWLRDVGASIAQRDGVLAAIEPSLIDAAIRKQPGRALLLTRRAIAAHQVHAAQLTDVRGEMSEALAVVGLVNPFQRGAHRRMYSELYGVDRPDRLFAAALTMSDFTAGTRAAIQAARTRHGNRTFFVRSHRTQHAAHLAERRLLRRHESSLLRQLYGPAAGMLGLDPELDAAASETARLERRMGDARTLAEAELNLLMRYVT